MRKPIGGVIHTYRQYDPTRFPSPSKPPPDTVSPAFEHLLMYGRRRPLTAEELARAVHLDPRQIAGLGPSIEALLEILRERKRKILATYETDGARRMATREYLDGVEAADPPKRLRGDFRRIARTEQLRDLEMLWYRLDDDRSPFAGQLVRLIESLGAKYQVEQLVAKYEFHGREPLSVEQALAVKEELERIDRLIKQLEEARETARIAVIDIDQLSEFVEPGDLERLEQLQRMVDDHVRDLAARQGLLDEGGGFRLTPQAYRIFQGKLLEKIFSDLQPSRTGRHSTPVAGEGAVELPGTKTYEFGDSVTQMDIPQSMINAMLRDGASLPIRLKPQDIEIHRTRNSPKCATVVIMDMSGSMRYDAQYVNVKRMALALEGLIRREYPGDFLRFIEMYTFARQRPAGEIVDLLPKPVTLHDPVVRLRADMSRQEISELMIPPHFTNIQHALQMARRMLASQDTPNRQVVLITDGLPTAHFEGSSLYLLYPPDPATESATMREGMLCRRDGVTINMFLVPSWSQSEEDIRFAYRLAESTRGRVFFTAGNDLDRFVVWDYVKRKREILA